MRLFHLVFASGILLHLSAWSWGASAAEQSKSFEYRLHVRSNIRDGYRIAPFSSFSSSDLTFNERGDVAVALNAIDGRTVSGIWSSLPKAGEENIVYRAPEGAYVSDPSLSSDGDVVFDLRHEDFRSLGLYVYRRESEKTERVLESARLRSAAELTGAVEKKKRVRSVPGGAGAVAPPSAHFFRVPQWITPNTWGFSVKAFNDGATYETFEADASEAGRQVHLADKRVDGKSKYTYLFNPSFNSSGAIAAKVRLGEKPDQILFWPAAGARPIVVAADRDADVTSRFVSFDNSVGLSRDGAVAFIATLADERRGVFRWKHGEITEIALTETELVSEVSYFRPAANGSGQVVFRGRDESGRETVFLGDGERLVKVVSKFDLLPSDLGPARVDQNRTEDTVFCGAPALNDRGEVAFCAALTPPKDNQTEWGSGVYVAAPRARY